MKFLFPPRSYERLEGLHLSQSGVLERVEVSEISAHGFRLNILENDIILEAADQSGLFYARQLLAEITEQYAGGGIPCCRISDWPDFEHRGYMLDISRDRVPTMEHFFHLVNQLAKLRYNQLQLYTEHSFAYSQHETVWANASPMTAAEIRELDQYCRERHIELVPNQNSFGHMERWLEHDAYKNLAECPEGFRHPISGAWRPQGSVIKPDEQSLVFLDGLYSELLPNFSSRKFNIGGDEPWELGKGASRSRVESEGKHKVYADFLARICQLAEQHGAEPMCWADVLLEAPALIEQLPESIQPVIWGYEVDHPFEKQCAQLAELGRKFYVAPGDSTWTSYTGRFSTMIANVKSAATIGRHHGAAGLLMTHWGDGGHPQPWPISLPGLVWAGLLSWNVNAEETSLGKVLRSLLGDENGVYTETLLSCGGVDDLLDVQLINRSYLAQVNQLDAMKLRAFKPRPNESEIRKVMRDSLDWIDGLSGSELSGQAPTFLTDELELALRLNLYAASRCIGEMDVPSDELRGLYQRCWHYRSRPSGLKGSLSKIHGMSD